MRQEPHSWSHRWPDMSIPSTARAGLTPVASRGSACFFYRRPADDPSKASGAPAAAPLSGCSRFAPSRSSPSGTAWRPPCASLARVRGRRRKGRGLRPRTSLTRPACGRWRRSPRGGWGCASASSGSAVLLCLSPCPVTLRLRGRGTGCACKGVFITLARYECFPLAPPSPPSLSFTGRKTQENGGQQRAGGRCEPQPFIEGLQI